MVLTATDVFNIAMRKREIISEHFNANNLPLIDHRVISSFSPKSFSFDLYFVHHLIYKTHLQNRMNTELLSTSCRDFWITLGE